MIALVKVTHNHIRIPMKILFVLETSGGGSGRHVIDLSRELIQSDCEVTVAYSGLRASADFYSEIKSVDNLKLVKIDMRRSPCPGDVIALKKLRHLLTEHGPFDVVHGHSSKGGALARLAALGLPGIKIYTPHAFRTLDPSLGMRSYKLYSMIERQLSKISTAIILVSEAEKQHALQLGLPADKLHVIQNGMVAQPFCSRDVARELMNIGQEECCIGFVGRLVPQKAPERLIRSFALIARKYPYARLVILGDGPLRAELQQLADQHNLNHQIKWLDGKAGTDCMPAMDMFVMPSLYEAFPYVLLEAANAGLPIIATPVGGTEAVLIDQVNGFLVEHNQPDALAQALERLIDNPELRVSMSAASKEIGQKYSVKSMAEKTLALYQSEIKVISKTNN